MVVRRVELRAPQSPKSPPPHGAKRWSSESFESSSPCDSSSPLRLVSNLPSPATTHLQARLPPAFLAPALSSFPALPLRHDSSSGSSSSLLSLCVSPVSARRLRPSRLPDHNHRPFSVSLVFPPFRSSPLRLQPSSPFSGSLASRPSLLALLSLPPSCYPYRRHEPLPSLPPFSPSFLSLSRSRLPPFSPSLPILPCSPPARAPLSRFWGCLRPPPAP